MISGGGGNREEEERVEEKLEIQVINNHYS
jgi:hypothetical protein